MGTIDAKVKKKNRCQRREEKGWKFKHLFLFLFFTSVSTIIDDHHACSCYYHCEIFIFYFLCEKGISIGGNLGRLVEFGFDIFGSSLFGPI